MGRARFLLYTGFIIIIIIILNARPWAERVSCSAHPRDLFIFASPLLIAQTELWLQINVTDSLFFIVY